MNYKAIIFDLDGTLLSTLGDLSASVNHALAVHKFPLRPVGEIRQFLGNGIRRLIEQSVPEGTPAEQTEQVLQTFREYYLLHSLDTTLPFSGIDDLLQQCKQMGMRTAIVSNKLDPAVQDLHRRFFPNTIDVAIGESATTRRKPAPDMVNEALRRLQCDAHEALYVGDSEVDSLTAQNAQMDCALVTWGYRDRDQLTDRPALAIIDRPAQLVALIKASPTP